MQFEQVLADCIDALDRGDTIEACLNRYPAEAQALLPLLALVVELHQQPKPRLSATAFTQLRATLATQAQQATGRSTIATFPSNGQRAGAIRRPLRRGERRPATSPVATARHRQGRSPAAQAPQDRVPGRRQPALRRLSLSLAIALLVGLVVFVRQVMVSLPGAPLYNVKTVSEQVQGLLMTAAGEEATWEARQATLRLGELVQLPPTATAQQATLAQRAALHVESALMASTTLAPAERVAFLTAWQADLQQLDATIQRNAANTPAQASVQAALTAVALALTPAPTVLPTSVELSTATASATTVLFSATATVLPTLSGATALPSVVPSSTITATATPTIAPTAVLVPTATRVELPPSTATATPLPVMTQVMPRETSTDRDNNDSQTDKVPPDSTATPAPTLEATTDPSVDDGDPGQSTPTVEATSTPLSTSTAPATSTTPTPVQTDEWLTPSATAELFTPTPWEPSVTPTEVPATATPQPGTTPALTEQPTLIATEAGTPIDEPPPGFATPPEPAATQELAPTATVAATTPVEPTATVADNNDAGDHTVRPRRRQTAAPPATPTP